MQKIKEFRKEPDRLSDLIPFAALVAESTVLNKDGSLQTTITFRGPDLDSATESELVSIAARLNNALRRLTSGFALYVEARRKQVRYYPASSFPEPISYLIDEERRASFEGYRHFESFYYLTLVYLPPTETKSKVTALFLEDKASSPANYERVLEYFEGEVKRILKLLEAVFPEARRLNDSETLTYLHSTVSFKEHEVSVPEVPIYLDSQLSDSNLSGGFKPQLGRHFLKVISIKNFPSRSHPGLLDRLNQLSLEYRWVTRFIFLDKSEAEKEIKNYKRRWFAKRKGIVTLLKEMVTSSQSIMEDPDAVHKAHDADEALSELLEDMVSYGYFTGCVILGSENEGELETWSVEVERAINGLGLVCKVEDVNALDAYLGSIPGNCRNNIRRPLLHTLNLCHLMPLSALWAGPKRDEHLKAPPLIYARTGGATQFRLSTHVGDVGHALVLGPTGAGKSVLLNLMEAQFLRYEGAQVYVFDKGGSAYVLTTSLGGDHYALGKEGVLSFQPLSQIHDISERRFAQEWLCDILLQENVSPTPKVKEALWKALCSLSSAPNEQRTLFGLTLLLQSEELRSALHPFTIEGPFGALLDSDGDNLLYGSFQCFEMESLLLLPSAVMPVLSYLFHRLSSRFTGRPTLLVLDEAWAYLENKAFAAKIREWLKELRKANVSVVFATQSLADVEESAISATVKEACFTKIYLPNAESLSDGPARFYKSFGLNERQLRILSEAIPKRHYYYTSPLGNRLFELGLEELSLTFCGATSREAQKKVRQIKKQTKTTEDFCRSYMEASGLAWACNAFNEFSKKGQIA